MFTSYEHGCKPSQENTSKLNLVSFIKKYTTCSSGIYSTHSRVVDFWKSTCVIHHIMVWMEKKKILHDNLNRCVKNIWQNPARVHEKATKLGIEGKFLSDKKHQSKQPQLTSDWRPWWRKDHMLFPMIRNKTRMSICTNSMHPVLLVPAREIRQGSEINEILHIDDRYREFQEIL